MSGFKASDGSSISEDAMKQTGFLMPHTETDSETLSEENIVSKDGCLDGATVGATKYHLNFVEGVYSEEITIAKGKEGLYSLYFVSCIKKPIDFDLELIQYNVDKNNNKNYLSIGLSNLPTIYGVFTIIHSAILILWIFGFLLPNGNEVNKLHYAMTLLVFLKIMSLFFQTIDQYYVKTKGSASGWNIPFYIFTSLKGIALFVIIALIGSGYQFIKPFLHDREKKIFTIVITLQVLDNIALIIVEETAPGSVGWLSWQHILKIVDVICCGAIIVPIFWSIRHLREAAQIDGKAAVSVRKLSLFRQFYLTVISYVYFTRIIIYLVEATLPYQMVWLGHMSSEAATLLFFVITGYNFR